MKIFLSWAPIALCGIGVASYHGRFGKPTPIYPDVNDPRVRQCAVNDLPLTTLKHYHLLMDRGFRCYTIRDRKVIREYRLPD